MEFVDPGCQRWVAKTVTTTTTQDPTVYAGTLNPQPTRLLGRFPFILETRKRVHSLCSDRPLIRCRPGMTGKHSPVAIRDRTRRRRPAPSRSSPAHMWRPRAAAPTTCCLAARRSPTRDRGVTTTSPPVCGIGTTPSSRLCPPVRSCSRWTHVPLAP